MYFPSEMHWDCSCMHGVPFANFLQDDFPPYWNNTWTGERERERDTWAGAAECKWKETASFVQSSQFWHLFSLPDSRFLKYIRACFNPAPLFCSSLSLSLFFSSGYWGGSGLRTIFMVSCSVLIYEISTNSTWLIFIDNTQNYDMIMSSNTSCHKMVLVGCNACRLTVCVGFCLVRVL